MIETEWLAATDPAPILEYLRGKGSKRKLRLFACACCWRIHEYTQESHEGRTILPIAEKLADGVATETELWSIRYLRKVPAFQDDENAQEGDFAYLGSEAMLSNAWDAACNAQEHCWLLCLRLRRSFAPLGKRLTYLMSKMWDGDGASVAVYDLPTPRAERVSQTKLLHEIFGNPFRPITIDPSWLTSTVIALTQQMYDSRVFSPMPILADALQDAGCDNEDILNHCRQPGEHCRGCWCVDLLLGKT
jgi:hypothetical protein